MDFFDIGNTEITGGFWNKREKLNRSKTVYAVYDRFKETGRIDAFSCTWENGKPNRPHCFWDSDVAKWIEGVAYLTQTKREPRLEKMADRIIDQIEKNQGEDGYFNIYFTVVNKHTNNRFESRQFHELYCAGHLIEAAVAYYNATGKRKLLDCMCRYANHIEDRFKIKKNTLFTTPGHEEIELALVKLYDCTGEKRYLELSEFFINQRGLKPEPMDDHVLKASYSQSHLPVREQLTAEGHAVRAVYLYCGMADIALKTGDKELLKACKALWEDITTRKMYITGGIGSSYNGEAFTLPYDLPNLGAYAESCAAIGLVLFAKRMMSLDNDAKYADIIERVLYNGFLSSTSLDGTAFFYENPLETNPDLKNRDTSMVESPVHYAMPERSKVFDCSCCPPNIVRFIPQISTLIYGTGTDTLYVNQFMTSKAAFELGGKKYTVEQKTRFPENGKIEIIVRGGNIKLAVRIPSWFAGKAEYKIYDVKDGEAIIIDYKMKPCLIEANPLVGADCGKVAMTRGPVVYCIESVDNGKNLRDIFVDGKCRAKYSKSSINGIGGIEARGFRKHWTSDELYKPYEKSFDEVTLHYIPYYAFANRGPSEMKVWVNVK